MADQNYNRPYRANDQNRRPSPQGPTPASGNDPLAELARLIGQNDPFAEYNPSASRAHEDSRAPAASPTDWQPSSDPAHDDFFRHPAAHSSYSDDQDADDNSRDAQSAPNDRYVSGQGYYDRNPGYSNPDPQHGADGYSDYQKPDQPEYEPSGYDQANPPRGGSDPAGYPRGGPRPDAYAGQESGSGNDHYSQGYAQNGAYSEQDSYPEEDVHGSDGRYDDPAETRRRGGLWTVIAVLGLAIVGTAGAFTYRATFGKSGSSQPQVIKRDAGPTKMAVAQGNDPQFGKPGLERVERIVPREESPVDVQQTPVSDSPPISFPSVVRPAVPSPPPSVALAPSPSTVAAPPKRIHTVPIKPSDADASAASVNPPPAVTNRVAPSRPPGPAPNAPLSLASAAQGRAAAPANPPVIRAPSGSAEGSFLVQVSSQRSESDAQASFRSLKAKYPEVMGDREPVIRRADLAEKGIYYRAMVGGFATAQEAGQFCESLKAAGGNCYIQRN
jgi:hypothetical protein